MKIQDDAFRIFYREMQTVEPYVSVYIEEELRKRPVVFKLKILRKFFRMKNKFLLDEIDDNTNHHITDDDVSKKAHEERLSQAR